jgi:hypothetical protein
VGAGRLAERPAAIAAGTEQGAACGAVAPEAEGRYTQGCGGAAPVHSTQPSSGWDVFATDFFGLRVEAGVLWEEGEHLAAVAAGAVFRDQQFGFEAID